MVARASGLQSPFRRYWVAGFLSDFGDGLCLAAFPLLAVGLSHSAAAVAAVTVAEQFPGLLLGAGLGVIVDRSDSRRVMVIVDIARAVIIAALAAVIFTHHADLALVYAVAFTTGTCSALRVTAEVTCVPCLVEPGNLEQANARMVGGQVVGGELAGPAAGGWLFGLAAAFPFAVNSGALGVGVLLMLTLPSVFRPANPAPARWPQATRLVSLGHDMREGMRWLWRHSEMRDVTIAVTVVSLTDAAWFAVLALYVIQVLHQKAGAYGLLLAVGALGGVAVGTIGPRLTRRLTPWSSLLIAGLVMAVTQAGLGLSANVIIAAIMLFLSSSAFALFNITAVTMRQRQVPPALLGRVTSLYVSVNYGAQVFGASAGGILATSAGIRAPMLVGALPLAAAMTFLASRHRK